MATIEAPDLSTTEIMCIILEAGDPGDTDELPVVTHETARPKAWHERLMEELGSGWTAEGIDPID